MCLCDEGSVRSACLPDDLRDTYNKDDEQQALSPTPDRFEKPSAAIGGGVKNDGTGSGTGGNNGHGSTGNSGTGSSTGWKIGSGGGVGEDSGNSRGTVGNGQENIGNGRGSIVGSANIGSVPSGGGDANGGSSRVSTTTVNSLPISSRNTCKYPCLNGGSCQGSVCVCRQGYNGENCAERK